MPCKRCKGLVLEVALAHTSPLHPLSGHGMGEMKRSFATACRRAEIEDLTFHNLRHTAINNWRLQGHDYFRIMAASGHKTMSVFKRYNSVSKEELKALVGGGNHS